jgi:hypothetical protein
MGLPQARRIGLLFSHFVLFQSSDQDIKQFLVFKSGRGMHFKMVPGSFNNESTGENVREGIDHLQMIDGMCASFFAEHIGNITDMPVHKTDHENFSHSTKHKC